MSISFSPRFCRANIIIRFQGETYKVGQHLINSTGLPGLPWPEFDPLINMGKRVEVGVQIVMAGTPVWQFKCVGTIACEITSQGAHLMGINFILDDETRTKLEKYVAEQALLPDYVRKMPRIHYMRHVPVFPRNAIIRYYSSSTDFSFVSEVENISPNGLRVFTEDYRSAEILPSGIVTVALQPRGPFGLEVKFQATVRGLALCVDHETNNAIRYLGLSINTLSDEAKVAYTDLLRQVVLQAKQASEAEKDNDTVAA